MDKPQKTKGTELQELTQMQLAFCEYLVMNEGRTTNKDAAYTLATVLREQPRKHMI